MNEQQPLDKYERRRFMIRAGLVPYLVGVFIGTFVAPIVSLTVFLGIGWPFVYGDGEPPKWFVILVVALGVSIAFVLPIFPARTRAKRKYEAHLEKLRNEPQDIRSIFG